MKIKFWGVRGSIPTPLTPEGLKRKIASIVQRIKVSDIESAESRELFLAQLPDYLFNTVGGNTTCVEVIPKSGARIILDCGTGLRELGLNLAKDKSLRELHIFLSHIHWDHIMGIPFFTPFFNPSLQVHLYSPREDMEKYVRGQMVDPYFPIEMSMFPANFTFHVLKEKQINIDNTRINWREVQHPGRCFSYRLQDESGSFIFSTDTELSAADFDKDDANSRFYREADTLVMDAQYTLGEAIDRYNWGHSSYSMAVDFASAFNIKRLVLFHHDPLSEDKKLYANLKSALWYTHHLSGHKPEILMAVEGMTLDV